MEATATPDESRPKRTSGRPRSPEARPDRATVRFTKLEYLAVKRRAQSARLTVADYCRQAVLTGKVQPILDPAVLPALHELRALSNTLHQLMKKAQEDGMRSVALKSDTLLNELNKLLAG